MVHMPETRWTIAFSARLHSFFMEFVHLCSVAASEGDMCRTELALGLHANPEWRRVLLRTQTDGHSREVFPLLISEGCESREVPVRDLFKTVLGDADAGVIEHIGRLEV